LEKSAQYIVARCLSPFPGTDGADVQYCTGETSSWLYPPHGLQGHFNKYIALLVMRDRKSVV